MEKPEHDDTQAGGEGSTSINDCGDWCKQDAESSWELKCTYDSCRGCGDCFGTALPSDGEVSQSRGPAATGARTAGGRGSPVGAEV